MEMDPLQWAVINQARIASLESSTVAKAMPPVAKARPGSATMTTSSGKGGSAEVATGMTTHPGEVEVAMDMPTHPGAVEVATGMQTHPGAVEVAMGTTTHPDTVGVAMGTTTHTDEVALTTSSGSGGYSDMDIMLVVGKHRLGLARDPPVVWVWLVAAWLTRSNPT